MPRKFNPPQKELLLNPSRQEALDTQRILSLLPIRTYEVVADIGCGPGYFTIPLAKYLFDGKVYAVDVQREILDTLKERLNRIHLTNIESILATEKKMQLKKETLDGALLAFVLHETDNKEGLLNQVFTSLKKGGWAAIIEWYKKEMVEGPPLEERVDAEQARELLEKVGFRFTSQRDLSGKYYMLLLRK